LLDHFVFSLNSVIPIFAVVFLGWFIRRRGLLDRESVARMNAVVFQFALPVMMFREISNASMDEIFDATLPAFAVVATLAIFGLTWLFTHLTVKEDKARGAFIQGAFRGNYTILGIPITANIMGPSNAGKAVLLATFVVPLYNVLSVFILCYYNGEGLSGKKLAKHTLMNIVKNPLIWGILLGIPFSAFQIEMPVAVSRSVNSLGGMATPLALIGIGASIDFRSFGQKLKPSLAAAAVKLLAAPLIVVPCAVAFGFRGESLAVLYVLSAVPSAVASYIMADSMGGDGELAGGIVVLTTFFSVFTFTFGIFILKSLGLF